LKNGTVENKNRDTRKEKGDGSILEEDGEG